MAIRSPAAAIAEGWVPLFPLPGVPGLAVIVWARNGELMTLASADGETWRDDILVRVRRT